MKTSICSILAFPFIEKVFIIYHNSILRFSFNGMLIGLIKIFILEFLALSSDVMFAAKIKKFIEIP